jgi:hypothetical protein
MHDDNLNDENNFEFNLMEYHDADSPPSGFFAIKKTTRIEIKIPAMRRLRYNGSHTFPVREYLHPCRSVVEIPSGGYIPTGTQDMHPYRTSKGNRFTSGSPGYWRL